MKQNNFSTELLDDDFVLYPIQIFYDYQIMLLGDVRILWYEWSLDPAARISKADVDSEVRRLIKIEERQQIEFI